MQDLQHGSDLGMQDKEVQEKTHRAIPPTRESLLKHRFLYRLCGATFTLKYYQGPANSQPMRLDPWTIVPMIGWCELHVWDLVGPSLLSDFALILLALKASSINKKTTTCKRENKPKCFLHCLLLLKKIFGTKISRLSIY